MKKAIALFAAAAIAMTVLTSCSLITINRGEEQAETTDTQTTGAALPEGLTEVTADTSAAKAEAQSQLDAVADRSFDNKSFTVAVTPGLSFAPSQPADGYDDALAERNAMVEKKYSISLGQIETPADLMLSDSYSAYLAGLYYSDLMMIPSGSLGAFAEKGYLLNVYSLPYISYDKPYFDTAAMSQAAAGYNAYAVMGSMTKDIGSYHCLYANTALFERLGLTLPYTAVGDGSWTWDALLELTRQAAGINGSVRNIACASVSGLVSTVYKSGGGYYMNTGLGVTPSVAFENDTAARAVDILRSLRDGDKVIFDNYSVSGSAISDFRAGNLLFYAGTVAEMGEVARMGAGWTLLPVPKTDAAAQGYTTFCSSEAPVLVTTAGNLYPEDTAYALEALGAASCGFLDYAYYDRVIRTGLNNSRTLDMLDFVSGVKSGTGLVDFIYMFSDQYPALTGSTADALWTLVCTPSSTLAGTAAAARSELDRRMNSAFPVIG